MATKIDREAAKALKDDPPKRREPEPEDLEIALPDRTITIRGERITVREFRFLEGVEVRAASRPLMDDLQALMGAPNRDEFGVYEMLLAKHKDLLATIMARACDRTEAWIAELSDTEGTALAVAFWAANSRFFMQRLVAAEAAAAGRSATPTSSPPSSPPASGATPTT